MNVNFEAKIYSFEVKPGPEVREKGAVGGGILGLEMGVLGIRGRVAKVR